MRAVIGLRAEFPVLERLAYLNAGTNGPVPRRAVEAVDASLRRQADEGRGDFAFIRHQALAPAERLRERVASTLGCGADELALTTCTTDGVNTVLRALDLGPGDEVLTSDEEHPGLLAPLAAARARAGVELNVVPFDELPGAVTARTRLVAASHVSWVTGRELDAAALAAAGAPVLLDGAQGLGAVPVDVRALGCDFYAASGQKWLCGPNGIGYLYVRASRVAELPAPAPSYVSLASPERALELDLHDSARRFDSGVVAPHSSAWALAALDVLEAPQLARVQERAVALAARLAAALGARGRELAPRASTTLVSWRADDPAAEVERLRGLGFVVRSLPERPWVRASVGGWSSEEEVERLAAAA
jgi:selenocysteine lyase/cysteine desulfurase